ncbi:MAG: hypothetical protein K0U98_11260 [Deltaproteobacteria bacterium]|nr:hypothetical protein [Deltaproteobacteria bacterium]
MTARRAASKAWPMWPGYVLLIVGALFYGAGDGDSMPIAKIARVLFPFFLYMTLGCLVTLRTPYRYAHVRRGEHPILFWVVTSVLAVTTGVLAFAAFLEV